MSPEQLAATVGRLQPLVAERLRAGGPWDLAGCVDDAAVLAGAVADPADVHLVGQMLDHACRPEGATPGEFGHLYEACLRGGTLEAARLQMALFGTVVLASWRARPAGGAED
ncbi:MAG: hypothetical protein U0Y82_15380 [Thermoleophilia bacterium]